MNFLYIKHKLSAHHFRHNRNWHKGTKLAICNCGWRCRLFRKIQRETYFRAFIHGCWFRGHDMQPVDDEMYQCTRCYKAVYDGR